MKNHSKETKNVSKNDYGFTLLFEPQKARHGDYYGRLDFYCLPVLLFILLNIERMGFVRIILCILLVLGFIWCVSEENNALKTKPLEGYSSVLLDDMRKKVVLFYALTPLLTILVLFLIGIMLDAIFGISDYMKRQGKNKK